MKPTLLENRGVPLDKQKFTWRDLVQKPISKLDDDAYTRVRIILMNGIELEAHALLAQRCARMNKALQLPLAQIRRVEQHQATMINWLIGADHSPLETTIAYEQVAIDVTAAVAQNEPDAYLAQVYRFGLLEDFDHMYRYSALLDRLEGKDANNILQSYTDILPGRPTVDEHRAPQDDLRRPYDRKSAAPLSKLHALTIMAAEQQTHNYYMNIGPMFADPVARQLYAEIASIEEQHVTQYESIIDPEESWLEKWVMHEARRGLQLLRLHAAGVQPAHQGDLGALPRLRARPPAAWRCELFKQHERRDIDGDPARVAARADPVRLAARVRARDARRRGRPAHQRHRDRAEERRRARPRSPTASR